jgi:glycerol-3-phosphate acyltransferase PlsY
MTPLALGAIVAVGGFLAGSVPFGVIASRALFKRDLRESGSGNIGAANALRTYGKGFGAAVLVLDAFKGFLPVALAHAYADGGGYAYAGIAALGAVLGHCFSPWLGWRGGKGVATLLGALFALSPYAGLGFVAIWLAAVVPTRYSSLGSLLGAGLAPLLVFALLRDAAAAACLCAVALTIAFKHRENIVRLREGREHRIALGREARE